MSNPRFSRDSDNRVTDAVSGHTTAVLTEDAAKLVVKGGNSADAIMRCMGSVASTHIEGGYAIQVDHNGFHVREV